MNTNRRSGVIVMVVSVFACAIISYALNEYTDDNYTYRKIDEGEIYMGGYNFITDSLIRIGEICPNCLSDSVADIKYGLYTKKGKEIQDSIRKATGGRRFILGGCCIGPEKYYCYKCSCRW